MKLAGWLIWLSVQLQFLESIHLISNLKEQYEEMGWNTVKTMMGNFISEDGKNFRPGVTQVLSMIEPHLCLEDVSNEDQCNNVKNWVLGCKCRNELLALPGQCKNLPCQILRLVKTEGPRIMSGIVAATSYEDRFRLLGNVWELIWSKLCECQEVVETTINCVKSYDSFLLTITKTNTTRFTDVVKNQDWVNLEGIAQEYLGAVCQKDCFNDFKTSLVNGGILIDNSLNGKDTCLSMKRVEDELDAIVDLQSNINDTSNITAEANNMVNNLRENLVETLYCKDDCAKEMQESFYFSCCIKRTWERLSSTNMRRRWIQVYNDVGGLLYPNAEAPEFIEEYFSMYRPAELCGDNTDVYKTMNEKCDALEN